jgi:hypothetical protein
MGNMSPASTAQAIPQDASRDDAWRRPLRDDFDGPDFAPLGGLYYRDNFEQSAGSLEFQSEVKRSGSGALKLSVREIAAAAGGEDHSERAEIWEKTALWAPYGQGMWYGFAVRFADPIPDDEHRYLIAQWKRQILPGAEGDFSPFLALRMTNGKLYATVETNHIAPRADAAPTGVPTFFRPRKNQMRALIATDAAWTEADARLFSGSSTALSLEHHGNPLPGPSSGWIEFAIFVKPGPDGDGHIEIIANGKPVVTVKGPIGHADKGLGDRQYFKFGPYRAGHSGVWTLYYDHFRRSPERADLAV